MLVRLLPEGSSIDVNEEQPRRRYALVLDRAEARPRQAARAR